MRFLAVLVGFFVMVVGVAGIAAPSALLRAAEYATTPIGLYAVAALRVGLGLVLIRVAPTSRTPQLLRVLGAIAVGAGVLTALVGVDRARAMLAWETAQGTTLIRLGALIALVFGGFIVSAVSGRRAA
jgi:hypothetical protein